MKNKENGKVIWKKFRKKKFCTEGEKTIMVDKYIVKKFSNKDMLVVVFIKIKYTNCFLNKNFNIKEIKVKVVRAKK